METTQLRSHLRIAIDAALAGGKEILKVYETADFGVEFKKDDSPLTQADKQAHEAIMEGLQGTALEVLSEEGKDIPYAARAQRDYFWMVDPLDGTKEFINRNGEFTVNIALIHKQLPLAGVIYVPVTDTLYFAAQDLGSFKLEGFAKKSGESLDSLMEMAQALPLPAPEGKIRVVGSRSHMNEATRAWIQKVEKQYGEVEMISRGSSLKLCMVAEGQARLYPRIAPTMEWDTAAGHAIVKYMGGEVLIADTGEEMRYNKENLLNPHFIVKYQVSI